jgi:hypothetical protein
VPRFKEDARRVLGPDAYDAIAVDAMKLPGEVPNDER